MGTVFKSTNNAVELLFLGLSSIVVKNMDFPLPKEEVMYLINLIS